jgi:hypothetical protein
VTIAEQVERFILSRAPHASCDACLADHLALSTKQAAYAAGRARRSRSFVRREGRCWGCCTNRTVTAVVAP